jgi:fructokinase
MKTGKRAVIFGEVLYDRFPDGSAVLGGAPFNVAWNLHALGLNPLLISRVGDDPLGHGIRSAMREWGMDTSGLQLDSAHPTGAVEVSFCDGEPSYDIVADRAYDFVEASQIPPLEEISLLYHGTLGVRNPVAENALVYLKGHAKGNVFVDVNLRDPWWQTDKTRELVRDARWAKLNSAEMEQLKGDGDLGGSLELLLVTHGAEGAEARLRDDKTVRVTPRPGEVKLVDTVGAGDAFASVVIAGLILGWEPEIMLERAQSFASRVVSLRGATTRDLDFYKRASEGWMPLA